MGKYYYDCSQCERQYKRADGRMGCQLIDKGRRYPIVTVTNNRSVHRGACVCEGYSPKVRPVAPVEAAERKSVWVTEVCQCGNCGRLLHSSAITCPHCGAYFKKGEGV